MSSIEIPGVVASCQEGEEGLQYVAQHRHPASLAALVGKAWQRSGQAVWGCASG
jgi:hypothetical protein